MRVRSFAFGVMLVLFIVEVKRMELSLLALLLTLKFLVKSYAVPTLFALLLLKFLMVVLVLLMLGMHLF
jgi:hypothetical protein